MPSYFIYVLALFWSDAGLAPDRYHILRSSRSLYICRLHILRHGGYGIVYHRPVDHPRAPVECWEAGVMIWQDRQLYTRIAAQNVKIQQMLDKSYQRGSGWTIPDIDDRVPPL